MGVMGSLSPTSRAAQNTRADTGFVPEFSLQFALNCIFQVFSFFFGKGSGAGGMPQKRCLDCNRWAVDNGARCVGHTRMRTRAKWAPHHGQLADDFAIKLIEPRAATPPIESVAGPFGVGADC